MGLLDQLWDDTVAGPLPDNGLGKLRKHSTFSFRSNSPKESEGSSRRSMGEEAAEDVTRVTRSIMIVKPQQLSMKDSPPVSPAGSTPPVSPFSEIKDELDENDVIDLILNRLRTVGESRSAGTLGLLETPLLSPGIRQRSLLMLMTQISPRGSIV